MKDREKPVNIARVAKSVSRFYEGNPRQQIEQATNEVEKLVDLGYTSAQIFQFISNGNGSPGTHCSQNADTGDLKDGCLPRRRLSSLRRNRIRRSR